MVKKYKLYTIGNVRDFNYYVFDKNQEEIEKLIEIFAKILGVDFNLYWTHTNKKGEQVNTKTNFNKFKDKHLYGIGHFDEKTRIDIFYGDKKIFVTVLCSQKLRLKFNEALFEFFDMPEYKHPKNAKKLKGKLKDKYQTIGPFEHNKNSLKKSKKKW